MKSCDILVLRDTFTNDPKKINFDMAELFGHHRINVDTQSNEISLSGYKLSFDSSPPSVKYSRSAGAESLAQTNIMSDKEQVVIGVFPIPPIYTPQPVARDLYLRFKLPIVVDQRSEVVVYAQMPIEIGVFRQSEDEELLIDAFSLAAQQYALYGSPENGVVCRYMETEVGDTKEKVELKKYQEALVRIRIRNDIDNIVKVSKVIIPMYGIILDHAHDEVWLPGSVEMVLDSAFGKDIVNVRLIDAKVKRPDKTSLLKKEETRTFLMDAGY